jgi:ubiquitin-protein ligase
MHLLLSCFELLEDREVMLDNILDILNVEEYVLFEDQSHEQKFLSLSGCVAGTSFENISYTKWKCIMINVANTLYKNRVYYVTDCRFL